MAGRAITLTRSLMQRRSRLISSAECSNCSSMSGHRWGRRSLPGTPFAKLPEELLRRYKERILLEYAADDDHRMRPHYINHHVSGKLRKIVYADNRVVVASPQIIYR